MLSCLLFSRGCQESPRKGWFAQAPVFLFDAIDWLDPHSSRFERGEVVERSSGIIKDSWGERNGASGANLLPIHPQGTTYECTVSFCLYLPLVYSLLFSTRDSPFFFCEWKAVECGPEFFMVNISVLIFSCCFVVKDKGSELH